MSRLSAKQRRSLLSLGIYPECYDPEAVEMFFALTDRGEGTYREHYLALGGLPADVNEYMVKPNQAQKDFSELVIDHRYREVTEVMWAEDFRQGLLFPIDFVECPLEQTDRAMRVRQQALYGES